MRKQWVNYNSRAVFSGYFPVFHFFLGRTVTLFKDIFLAKVSLKTWLKRMWIVIPILLPPPITQSCLFEEVCYLILASSQRKLREYVEFIKFDVTIEKRMWIGIPILLPHRFHKVLSSRKYVAWFSLPHRGRFVDTSNFYNLMSR